MKQNRWDLKTNWRFPLPLEMQCTKLKWMTWKSLPTAPKSSLEFQVKKAPFFNDFGCMHSAERTQQIFAINRSFSLQNFGNLVVRPFTFRKCTFLVFPGFLPSCVSPPAEVTEFKKSSSLGFRIIKSHTKKEQVTGNVIVCSLVDPYLLTGQTKDFKKGR